MASQTGTLDITSLLEARFSSAAAYGLDTIEKVLQRDLAAHNDLVMGMMGDLCEVTTDRQRIYGTSANGDMQETDEYGLTPTQKILPGATVGFPLKLFQYNLGWTSKWFQTHSPADMATAVLAAEKAHKRELMRQIKKALFLSANYTHLDHLVDNVSLAVKRLLNADSTLIPDGPNGEVFTPASHTHYTGVATLTAAGQLAVINNVIEHGHGNKVIIVISKTDETAFRALTGFVAYVDPRIISNVSADHLGNTLDISRLDNRAIGVFMGAEVWVKSWAIANYSFVYDAMDPNKPLCFRQRANTTLVGLRIAATMDEYPLYAKDMEAEFGIGVWTRTNGALAYNANVTWADPTIT